LEELSKVYYDQNNPSLGPPATFYFVKCIEALAFYVIIYEQISSTNIEVLTGDVLKPRIWDLINKKKNWQHIAGQKNVEKLFRDFDFGGNGGGPGDGPPGAPGGAITVNPFQATPDADTRGDPSDDPSGGPPPPLPPRPTLPTAPPSVIPPRPPTSSSGTQTYPAANPSSSTQTTNASTNSGSTQTDYNMTSSSGGPPPPPPPAPAAAVANASSSSGPQTSRKRGRKNDGTQVDNSTGPPGAPPPPSAPAIARMPTGINSGAQPLPQPISRVPSQGQRPDTYGDPLMVPSIPRPPSPPPGGQAIAVPSTQYYRMDVDDDMANDEVFRNANRGMSVPARAPLEPSHIPMAPRFADNWNTSRIGQIPGVPEFAKD